MSASVISSQRLSTCQTWRTLLYLDQVCNLKANDIEISYSTNICGQMVQQMHLYSDFPNENSTCNRDGQIVRSLGRVGIDYNAPSSACLKSILTTE